MAFDREKTLAMMRELDQRLEQVLDALGLTEIRKRACGKRREFKLPWRENGEASIYLDGARKGGWIHFSGGDSGDLFDLIAAMCGGGIKKRDEAYKWAKSFLGWDREFSPEEKKKWQERCATNAKIYEMETKKREQKALSELKTKRRGAKAKFLNIPFSESGTRRIIEGDRVWNYLMARGIDLHRLNGAPGSLRFWPDHEYRDENGGKIRFDCMVGGFYLPDGNFAAMHRTWLDPDQMEKKAPIYITKTDGTRVQKARKIWPEFAGAFIPLWKGESGVSRAKAKPQSETIIICEGIEDGLTHALWRPDCRIDVVGSLQNFANYEPPKSCRELIIAADRDWNNGQAKEQLDIACQKLADLGAPSPIKPKNFTVKVMFPPDGYKDFNDALLRKKAEK